MVRDDEGSQPVEGVLDVGDLVGELCCAGLDGLFEQGEEQLVLAGEVLVEAPQRLAGALDDHLEREVPAVGQEVAGGVDEGRHLHLRAFAGGFDCTRHRYVAS